MGSRGERHLSRLAVPKTWKIQKKIRKWITRPLPGAHPFELGMPLMLIIRDLLRYANTAKEVKKILNSKEVMVDGIMRKEPKFIAGVMDVVSIMKTKENFRVWLDKNGRISLLPVKAEESKIKPCRIIGKTAVKNKKYQINLYDGKNILAEKVDAKVGDTVLIEIPSQKIKEVLKLQKGAFVLLIGGKKIGETGVVEELKGDRIVCRKGHEKFETLKEYAFVIGKEKPAIEIPH